jgi:hypothetical protein
MRKTVHDPRAMLTASANNNDILRHDDRCKYDNEGEQKCSERRFWGKLRRSGVFVWQMDGLQLVAANAECLGNVMR